MHDGAHVWRYRTGSHIRMEWLNEQFDDAKQL